jgi:hypothetical protein
MCFSAGVRLLPYCSHRSNHFSFEVPGSWYTGGSSKRSTSSRSDRIRTIGAVDLHSSVLPMIISEQKKRFSVIF